MGGSGGTEMAVTRGPSQGSGRPRERQGCGGGEEGAGENSFRGRVVRIGLWKDGGRGTRCH